MIGSYIDLGNPVADHPLNRTLTSWFLLLPPIAGGSRFFDLCRRFTGTLTGGPTWTASRNEWSALACIAITHYVSAGSTDLMFPSQTDGSIVISNRKRDTTLRASSSFGTTLASTKKINVHMPYSDGTVYFDWAGESSGSTRLSIAGLSFDTNQDHWVFTVGGGNGMKIYRKGVQVASNAATPSRTLDATNVCDINRGLGASSTPGDISDYLEVRTYASALQASDAWRLYEDWREGYKDTLRRFSRRVYSFGTVAAGGSTVPRKQHSYRRRRVA